MKTRCKGDATQKQSTSGFTLIEIVIGLTIISAVVLLFVPRVQEALQGNAVRGARAAVSTHVARARGAAASRGCTSTLHFVAGADARVWVTSCPVNGSPSAIDTVGAVDALSARYQVALTTTAASVSFQPTGVSTAAGWTRLTFTHGEDAEELEISPVGKTSW